MARAAMVMGSHCEMRRCAVFAAVERDGEPVRSGHDGAETVPGLTGCDTSRGSCVKPMMSSEPEIRRHRPRSLAKPGRSLGGLEGADGL